MIKYLSSLAISVLFALSLGPLPARCQLVTEEQYEPPKLPVWTPETWKMVENNIEAMTELGQAHGVKVILCSMTPVSDYTKAKQTGRLPPDQIVKLNTWLHAYATQASAGYADYYSVLVDSKGMLREGFSEDGVHPNSRGYELMAPVARSAIDKVLQ